MTNPITPAKLAELKLLCESATQEPWRLELEDEYHEGKIRGFNDVVCDFGGSTSCEGWPGSAPNKADLAFIAEARAALPALITELEQTRAELNEIKARLNTRDFATKLRDQRKAAAEIEAKLDHRTVSTLETEACPVCAAHPDDKENCPVCVPITKRVSVVPPQSEEPDEPEPTPALRELMSGGQEPKYVGRSYGLFCVNDSIEYMDGYRQALSDAAALAEKLAGTYHCVNASTVAEAIRSLTPKGPDHE
jgi:hypothetical protein